MLRLLCISFSAALVFIAGCGNGGAKKYPVHGVVRFPDGKLLRRGTVEFDLIGGETPITATGEIRPDGSFTMGTDDLDDGALAGKYRAVVISDHQIGNSFERPGFIPAQLVHERYREFHTSELEFEVQPKTNNIVIDIEYAPKPGAESTQ